MTNCTMLVKALDIEGVSKPVYPVTGKLMNYLLKHGGYEWLEEEGFMSAFSDSPVFNARRKYIIFVSSDGYYVPVRWEVASYWH